MNNVRLTKREYDILIRLAMSNIDIADELGLTESYVNQVAYRISLKLGTHSRTGAVIQAIKHNLVTPWNFKV